MTTLLPDVSRSTEPLDYQHLPQPISAMAKSFADGFEIALHQHDRDQLLYAISGVMHLQTDRAAWVVPPDRAVYIPASVPHTVSIYGQVDMRTLYIDPEATTVRDRSLRVHHVSNLLRELILALSAEPIAYENGSRGDYLAKLIASEIERASDLWLGTPLPRDARLQRLCAAFLADPSDTRGLEAWADIAGASKRTLSRLFDHDMGMSFSAWRQRVRFHNALEALSQGHPISRVAAQNGYRSVSAFSVAFRKQMGVPPSAFTLGDPGGRE
jgi:AraC-like DNA-binding protein/quercetin dioxygenase-like cupin family protein